MKALVGLALAAICSVYLTIYLVVELIRAIIESGI